MHRPSFRILHSAFCIALALAAASARATPGWTSAALTTRNEYPRYMNALRDRLPYIFTNGNASASASTASSFTDGMIVLKSGATKQIGNNSSLFYKLSDDPAGIDLKNVRITTSWNDSGRDQISISKLLVKTVAGGDVWSELPNSSPPAALASVITRASTPTQTAPPSPRARQIYAFASAHRRTTTSATRRLKLKSPFRATSTSPLPSHRPPLVL